jgi:hypothetical protein
LIIVWRFSGEALDEVFEVLWFDVDDSRVIMENPRHMIFLVGRFRRSLVVVMGGGRWW